MVRAFQAAFQDVQWIVLAYLLVITTLIVSLGRRRLFLTGILILTLALVLCGLAPSLPFLIAARAIQGLGVAIMLALLGGAGMFYSAALW